MKSMYRFVYHTPIVYFFPRGKSQFAFFCGLRTFPETPVILFYDSCNQENWQDAVGTLNAENILESSSFIHQIRWFWLWIIHFWLNLLFTNIIFGFKFHIKEKYTFYEVFPDDCLPWLITGVLSYGVDLISFYWYNMSEVHYFWCWVLLN